MQQTFFYIFLYALFNVSGAAIVKLQLKHTRLTNWQDWLSLLMNNRFIIAAFLIVFSALAMFKALSVNHFSFVIPVATGINFLFTVLIGYLLFQDRLTFGTFVGFTLIIGGILVLSINSSQA